MMSNSTFRLIAALIAWGSLYPLTLTAIFLFDSSAKQELLWQLQFESHYLLARQLLFDILSALTFTSLWFVALIFYQLLSNRSHLKTASWVFVSYPFALAATLQIFSIPDIFWQTAIIGGLLNFLFAGKKK
jgi:hypothetical protein